MSSLGGREAGHHFFSTRAADSHHERQLGAHAPPAAQAGGGAGNGQAAAPKPPTEGPIPSRAVLEAVVAGSREFSKEQREWTVGECMALTGWEFTPVELIQHGDAWMAQKILASPNPPA